MRTSEADQLNEDQALARIHSWLWNNSNTKWLLILDDYDEPDQFSIDDCLPNSGHGSIIITTRLPGGDLSLNQAELIQWIEQLLQEQVQLSAAVRMYSRALSGYKTALNLDHTSTLGTVNNLSLLYRDQGKLDQAEQMYLRALGGKDTALGVNFDQ